MLWIIKIPPWRPERIMWFRRGSQNVNGVYVDFYDWLYYHTVAEDRLCFAETGIKETKNVEHEDFKEYSAEYGSLLKRRIRDV